MFILYTIFILLDHILLLTIVFYWRFVESITLHSFLKIHHLAHIFLQLLLLLTKLLTSIECIHQLCRSLIFCKHTPSSTSCFVYLHLISINISTPVRQSMAHYSFNFIFKQYSSWYQVSLSHTNIFWNFHLLVYETFLWNSILALWLQEYYYSILYRL